MDRTAIWQSALDLHTRLQPELDKLEKKRKGHLLFLAVSIPLTCAVILPFVFIYVFAHTPHSPMPTLVIAMMIALSISVTFYRGFDHDYRRKAKRQLVYKMAAAMNMKYNPQGLFPVGEIYDHYILPAYNVGKAEDGFSFKLADRRVEMQEIYLQRTHDDETFRLPRFLPASERGIVLRVEARKTQPFHTVVIPRSFTHGGYHRLHFQGMRHYEKTPFGNPSFSRRYDVLSEDHSDAHDIFDHAFIEAFLAFEREAQARSLAVSFKKREIIFYARKGQDFFEPGHLLRPVTVETIREIYEELATLSAMIETLKLNPYVGL